LSELGAPCSANSSPPVETVFRDWLKEKQMEISAVTLDFYRQFIKGTERYVPKGPFGIKRVSIS
jgi:hypothetical protein